MSFTVELLKVFNVVSNTEYTEFAKFLVSLQELLKLIVPYQQLAPHQLVYQPDPHFSRWTMDVEEGSKTIKNIVTYRLHLT